VAKLELGVECVPKPELGNKGNQLHLAKVLRKDKYQYLTPNSYLLTPFRETIVSPFLIAFDTVEIGFQIRQNGKGVKHRGSRARNPLCASLF